MKPHPVFRKMDTAVFLALIVFAAHASVTTIDSPNPVYFAQVDGTRLLAITVPPKELNLDMNAVNSIRSETGDFKQARYYFPNSVVPRTALKHLQSIYRYERRRDVPIVSSGGDWVIAEHFEANSHIPTCRFRLLGSRVQRQEQLDSSGRVTKVILVGWAPAQSVEDEDVSDPSSLGQYPGWIRVFKVSAGGRKMLVALAWRRQGLEALKSTSEAPDDSELQFGLPDGTVRWHSMAAFAEANDIDLLATRLLGRWRHR
jgi:hypothetical protein